MKNKIRIISLFSVWAIEIFALRHWFDCWLFKENFYFTNNTLMNVLINATNADKGIPIIMVRAIHNKALALGWGIMQSILQYWDIRFLNELLGVVGALGVGYGVWYFATQDRKNKSIGVLLLLSLLIQIFEIYFMPHAKWAWTIGVIAGVFQILSLYGIWKFLGQGNKRIRYISFAIVCIISLLFLFLFPSMFQNFCINK